MQVIFVDFRRQSQKEKRWTSNVSLYKKHSIIHVTNCITLSVLYILLFPIIQQNNTCTYKHQSNDQIKRWNIAAFTQKQTGQQYPENRNHKTKDSHFGYRIVL